MRTRRQFLTASLTAALAALAANRFPRAWAADETPKRLMETYPNLFCDLSAGSGANAISRDKDFGREFMIRRQDRLLFGADYLQPGQGVPQFELFDSLNLPAEAQAKIYRENAQRVLRLSS